MQSIPACHHVGRMAINNGTGSLKRGRLLIPRRATCRRRQRTTSHPLNLPLSGVEKRTFSAGYYRWCAWSVTINWKVQKKKKKKAQVTAMLRKCDRRRPAQNKVERKSTQFHQRGRWHGCVLDFPLFA